jgi:hypothetical protein
MELPDDALLPCFKYRTNADPRAGDLKIKPKFNKKELAYLAEVYPGMLYDGDSCTTNLDRFIMKKVGASCCCSGVEELLVSGVCDSVTR